MLLQDWTNDEFVDCQCSFGLWGHQEYEESDSNVEIEGDKVENESSELVKEVEETENGPVGEPFLIVVLTL